MRTQIHVNQHVIRRNRATGGREPVITVKTYRENIKTNHVTIHGPSTVVYSPDKPLACGATVWVETQAPVTCED